MIDIHSHIAWGIDDGFSNQSDAKKALKNAKQDGIDIICSTPHFVPGQLDPERVDKITKRQRECKLLAKEYGIVLCFGSEVFLNHEYLSVFDQKLYKTLNGSRYVLVEFDVRKDIRDIEFSEDALYEISIRDLVPVIAHVERYFPKGIDIERVKEWKRQGFVIQVNRTSLQGIHGRKIQKNAKRLLKEHLADVIASDAHRLDGHRTEELADIYIVVSRKYGKEYARDLFVNNPLKLLKNEEV